MLFEIRVLFYRFWLLVALKFSQRMRDKRLVYKTAQNLMPIGTRDCPECDGLRCEDCYYSGLEDTRLLRAHQEAAAVRQVKEDYRRTVEDARRIMGDVRKMMDSIHGKR
jgi:hypothetical protein